MFSKLHLNGIAQYHIFVTISSTEREQVTFTHLRLKKILFILYLILIISLVFLNVKLTVIIVNIIIYYIIRQVLDPNK